MKRHRDQEISASDLSDGVSSDSSLDSSCESEISDASDVEFTFETFNMSPDDFHTVKQFMINVFGQGIEGIKSGDNTLDLTALSKLVTEELCQYMGTTAKTDQDVLSFIAMVPLRVDRLEGNCSTDSTLSGVTKTLYHILLKSFHKNASFASKKEKELVLRAMEAPERLAVIFHERFMNLPGEMAAPLLKQLADDLVEAIEESPVFDSAHYLYITPVYRELSCTDGGTIDPTDESVNDTYKYYYEESALLEDIAIGSWDFRIKSVHDLESAPSRRAFGDRGVDAARRVFVIPSDAFGLYVDRCLHLLP